MPDIPQVLEADAVLFMHDQAIKEYGGTHGLKSEDLLHSTLARVENRWPSAEAPRSDAATLAAAYAYGIVRNHPFNDANKRTAWSCCVLFLRLNETRVQVSAPDVVEVMLAFVSGTIEQGALASWLPPALPDWGLFLCSASREGFFLSLTANPPFEGLQSSLFPAMKGLVHVQQNR